MNLHETMLTIVVSMDENEKCPGGGQLPLPFKSNDAAKNSLEKAVSKLATNVPCRSGIGVVHVSEGTVGRLTLAQTIPAAEEYVLSLGRKNT